MIVFLDFDGVLMPVPPSGEGVFSHIGVFERWLRRRPGVDVVISSSWREVHPFDELVSYFASDLQARIIGRTPRYRQEPPEGGGTAEVDASGDSLYQREAEVRRWMRDSGDPGRRFAILDDMAQLFSPGCPELVLCDPRACLTPAVLAELDAMLGFEDA